MLPKIPQPIGNIIVFYDGDNPPKYLKSLGRWTDNLEEAHLFLHVEDAIVAADTHAYFCHCQLTVVWREGNNNVHSVDYFGYRTK